jgi:hypothetical protein
MHPWRGLGLAQADHASMPQGHRMLLEVDHEAPEPIFRGW